jgi:hypothetical protein
MNYCVSGHENPTGASYCITCGKDLSLEAPTSGRQCIHGHPMSSLDETCRHCGNLPASEKTEVGVRQSSTSSTGLMAKLVLTDMQEDATKFLLKVQTKSKIDLKILFLVLVLVITTPSAYFGYTVYAGPNYKGKTVEEVFKNREDQIAAVLEPACSVGKSEISEAEAEITSTSAAIEADYNYAFRNGVRPPSVGDVRKEIGNEVERQLKASLGNKYSQLDNKTSVLSSSEDSAVAFCRLGGALTGLLATSKALDFKLSEMPNYKGKTVEEVFKNREDQIAAVLEPACSVGTNEISEAEAEITSTSAAIAADYHYALRSGVRPPSVGDVRKEIGNEVERQLKASLGNKYSQLDNKTSVLSSSEDSAVAFCRLEGALTGLLATSKALDQTISGIKSPGSWAGSEYYYDEVDPNMAWKWASTSSFPHGGWAVDVISRLGCPDGSEVTMFTTLGNYSRNSGYLSPGGEARFNFYFTDEANTGYSGTVTSVTCR